MNNDKIKQLEEILKKLNNGEASEAVKAEARDFLETVSPVDLSMAEQSLIDNGLAPSALRNLCSAHMEVLEESTGSIKDQLEPNHIIHTLMVEHEILLLFLSDLEKINNEIQKEEALLEIGVYNKLSDLAKSLIGAEPHHQREEKVLFPALEAAGVSGPPRIMKMEHEDMRELKKELLKLSEVGSSLNILDFKKQLQEITASLVYKLRDHIFKENNILYPTALNMISDEEMWLKMKKECDLMGYCDFTPTVNI